MQIDLEFTTQKLTSVLGSEGIDDLILTEIYSLDVVNYKMQSFRGSRIGIGQVDVMSVSACLLHEVVINPLSFDLS